MPFSEPGGLFWRRAAIAGLIAIDVPAIRWELDRDSDAGSGASTGAASKLARLAPAGGDSAGHAWVGLASTSRLK